MNQTQAPPKTAITCPRCDNWRTGYGPPRRNYPCWSLPGSDIPWFSDNEES